MTEREKNGKLLIEFVSANSIFFAFIVSRKQLLGEIINTIRKEKCIMSVVIVGGNERMVCQYEDICKGYGCKAKVFAKEKGAMKKKIGAPDLMILFTSTVSHKMVNCAVEEAKRKSIPVCRCHTSSAAALENILKEYCA